jgi:hypothetical protein
MAQANIPTLDTASMAEAETHSLRKIHDAGGDAAFDRAARAKLFATAALIARVRGRDRLTDLMNAIDVAIPL